MTMQELRDAWQGIVGPQIAHVTTPAAFDCHGTLHITAASQAWLRELSAVGQAVTLIRKLPARIDGAPVVAIRYHLRASA